MASCQISQNRKFLGQSNLTLDCWWPSAVLYLWNFKDRNNVCEAIIYNYFLAVMRNLGVTGAIVGRKWKFFAENTKRDETGSRSRSRSLKMAPFDRSYTTFYWSAIVNIAVCCTIFKLFGVE